MPQTPKNFHQKFQFQFGANMSWFVIPEIQTVVPGGVVDLSGVV